jgi:hypothetical protein
MAGLRRQSDPDLGEAEKRPPLARLFAQDFRRIDDEQEESGVRERVRSLEYFRPSCSASTWSARPPSCSHSAPR